MFYFNNRWFRLWVAVFVLLFSMIFFFFLREISALNITDQLRDLGTARLEGANYGRIC